MTTVLTLGSPSRAADGAFLAAADLAAVAAELDVEYRLVGGNAVTLLTAVHGVTELVPGRETADADFGASYRVVADPRLPAALAAKGYERVSGNRFVHVRDDGLRSTIDVLAPSYEGRLVSNQAHGDLVVDEVPGLAFALARPATVVSVDVALSIGVRATATLALPDVVSALCLKAYAYAGRMAARDALDVWRLLESAHAAGVTAADWPTGVTARGAADVVRRHFARPGAHGPRDASRSASDQARVRALAARVVTGA